MNEPQNMTTDPSTVEEKQSKTMSEAALAANRANARKSTGPRTPAGKLKAASNSLKHGLYSMKNFDHFVADHDDALSVATNYIEQFNPITPTEVTLVHQLIHMQLRFMQMEFLYGEAMRFRVEDIINKPVTFLPAIMRELDRLPTKIQRLIKTIRAEIAQREAFIGHGENVEIEPIPDPPKLPQPPANEWYGATLTEKGLVANDKVKQEPKEYPLVKTAQDIIANYKATMDAKHGITPPKAE